MVEDPLKLFVLEYSINQDASNVRTLGAVLENNRRNLARGLSTDFVPIGLFNSREEVDKADLAFRSLALEAQQERGSWNWHHISEVLETVLPRDLNDPNASD